MENLQPFLISLGLLSVGGIGLIFYKDKEFGLSLKTDDTLDEDEDKNDTPEENKEETKKTIKKRQSRSTTLTNKKKTNQHKNTKRNRVMG